MLLKDVLGMTVLMEEKETHEIAIKIARPITKAFKAANFDSFTSDCSLAAHHIENSLGNIVEPEHPISLIKKAYGIKNEIKPEDLLSLKNMTLREIR